MRLASLLLAALSAASTPAAPSTDAPATAPVHDFGKVVRGRPVEHVFLVRNSGRSPARVLRVLLTPPLVATRLPGAISAGGEGAVGVRLDTTKLSGMFEGEVAVFLEGSEQPASFGLRGRVVGSVEVSPRPALFASAVRGDRKTAEVELVNHEPEPLRIERVESASPRFTTQVDELERGRRYRLRITTRPDAPIGRAQELILVHTSSAASPVVRVTAFTNVHERVYTFPDAVDLGAIRQADLVRDPDLAARLAQTLMVYQVGGTAFEARFRTELPSLSVTAERGPKGDRWQATVRLSGTPRPGPIAGTIVVDTNVPEFPRVEIPVRGTILE
jgi:hypothetical protein